MFKNYNSLGFHSKYFIIEDSKFKIMRSFSEAILNKKNNEIDVVALIEFVNRFYFFGDRTLFKDLQKTPWLAQPNTKQTGWDYAVVDDNEIKISSEEEFAKAFINRIENEIVNYIGKSARTGILLTGGMDSRVVAALVHKLNKEKRINTSVVAYTWGMPLSRDVVYAKRIADKYAWEFKSFELSAEILKQNIRATAQEGCEFSPIHLHGVLEIAKQNDIDVILAGSFGDSIGRAEYSGTHASQLKSLGEDIVNKFGFLDQSVFNQNLSFVKNDLLHYASLFPRQQAYSNFEIEHMAHYMRRELNPCMTLIDREIPLFQVFSSPEVYNLVLNVPLLYRNDKLYYNVLTTVDRDLLQIPWARTGKLYLDETGEEDTTHTKDYHDYAKWIRQDLSLYLEKLIFNGNLEKLQVFNMPIIRFAFQFNKRFHSKGTNRIDELMVWLASLSLLLDEVEIKTTIKKTPTCVLRSIKTKLQIMLYSAVTHLKSRL